jgi:hypothetical protein
VDVEGATRPFRQTLRCLHSDAPGHNPALHNDDYTHHERAAESVAEQIRLDELVDGLKMSDIPGDFHGARSKLNPCWCCGLRFSRIEHGSGGRPTVVAEHSRSTT